MPCEPTGQFDQFVPASGKRRRGLRLGWLPATPCKIVVCKESAASSPPGCIVGGDSLRSEGATCTIYVFRF